MSELQECDQFKDHRREICRGERLDMPLEGHNSINAYRGLWGLPPLGAPSGESPAPTTEKPCPDTGRVLESTPLPTVLQLVTRFAAALTTHVKDGLARCDEPQIATRLAICRDCPEFTGSQCRKCGCACNGRSTFFNKLAWQSEVCPTGRW